MAQKQLKEGDKAPSFTLLSDKNEKVSLKDYLGKTVVLYFYPKDLTPGCTTQACDFRDQSSLFKKREIAVLGVSKDSVELHQKFKKTHDLNFPLLSDPEGEVCTAYGVWREKSMYGKKFMGIVRMTFVISPEGKIQKIYDNVKATGHVENLLSEL